MGAKIGDDHDEIMAEINITPMVDIMLVLLIIFMVTASVINDPGIEVELPAASTGEESESSMLGLILDKDSNLYLNGQAITEEDLRSFIRSEKAADADLVALIAADKTVPHGDVVALIDLVKTEGVLKFSINIDPKAALAALGTKQPPEGSPGEASGEL